MGPIAFKWPNVQTFGRPEQTVPIFSAMRPELITLNPDLKNGFLLCRNARLGFTQRWHNRVLDYVLTVQFADVAAYDLFYKRLTSRISVSDISASFVMEDIRHTTALPL